MELSALVLWFLTLIAAFLAGKWVKSRSQARNDALMREAISELGRHLTENKPDAIKQA